MEWEGDGLWALGDDWKICLWCREVRLGSLLFMQEVTCTSLYERTL